MRALAILLLAAGLRGADAPDAADRAWAEGLAAFDRAQAADALGDGELAKRELRAARTALDDAIARYRAQIDASRAKLPDAERRLGEAREVGHACCGKTSLWKRYGIEEAEQPAKPAPTPTR